MTIDEKLDKILGNQAAIMPMVKDHHKTLYGNGRAGVVEIVTILKQRMSSRSFATLLVIQVIFCVTAIVSVIIQIIN